MIAKLSKFALGAVALVALAGGAWFVWYREAAQPLIAGEARLVGLDGPVDIVRDAEGVPHIYAGNEANAVFAQGFVHAQDRLWQMEMQRRVTSGRVAELVGARGLETDRFIRTMGIARAAATIHSGLDDETRAMFASYARGVNAYLATRTGPLPPEFLILGAPAPEPWTAVDAVGWSLMMAWDLGGNWRNELLRLQLAQKGMSNAEIAQFSPPYPGDAYPELPELRALYRDLRAETAAAAKLLAGLPGPDEGLGSNNWVVAGARSETGKPLLANDPHLGLGAPALWYFVHLAAPGLDVIGASLPGVPGVVLGRNKRIAWGFTNTGPDVQDLYVEKIDPANSDNYLTPDGSRPFETREERIKVKGAPDEVLKVRISRHGPIISDGAIEGVSKAANKSYAIAFAWTALAADNRSPRAIARMGKAANWAEFQDAARDFHAPQQNMVYADVDGNIGYVAAGRVPIRKKENDLKGLFPAPGWDARYDWAGYIPFEELPREFNPPRGWRMTANEKIVGPDYPHHITYDWTERYRADRITALIEARPKHNVESFAAIQRDVMSLAVQDLLPHLLAAPALGPKEAKAIMDLKGWDATMASERAEPLIVTAWMRELSRLIYADELGAELMKTQWDQRQRFLLAAISGAGAQAWCDNVTTPAKETCPDQIARALTLALADLEKRFGSDQKFWRWGDAHMARSTHRPLGALPGIGSLFDIRVPTGGDTYTVNVGRHVIRTEAEPFVSVHAASLRAIYDLADLENSRFMHSTGQSGLFFSRLYNNFAKRWAEVKYIPMRTERARVEKDALGTLRLRP